MFAGAKRGSYPAYGIHSARIAYSFADPQRDEKLYQEIYKYVFEKFEKLTK